MIVMLSEKLKEKLERVKKRTWCPFANLADVLEKPKKYIYRKINDGKFEIINDTGIMKISSDSVVKFFENRYQKV